MVLRLFGACVLLVLAACTSSTNRDRETIDGYEFRMKADTPGDNALQFVSTARPVSQSLDAARKAAAHRGVRYCIETFGTSRIKWQIGPETDPATLVIENDTIVFTGICDR